MTVTDTQDSWGRRWLYPSMSSEEMQAILDFEAAEGGGVVMTAPGAYDIDATLLWPARVSIVNPAWDEGYNSNLADGGTIDQQSVVWTLANGVNAPIIEGKDDGATAVSKKQQTSVLRGIAFNGNRANNTFTNKGLVDLRQLIVPRMWGCTVYQSPAVGVWLGFCLGPRLMHVASLFNNGHGINIEGSTDGYLQMCNGSRNLGASTDGIHLAKACVLMTLDHCYAFNNGRHGIHLFSNSVDNDNASNSIDLCRADDNTGSGIVLTGLATHNVVNGGMTVRNAASGLLLAEDTANSTGPSDTNVIGLVSTNLQGSTDQLYGVDIEANCDDNSFFACDLRGNTTAATRDLGTGNSIDAAMNRV